MRALAAVALASCLLSVSQPRADELLDGITYDQLKAILTDTNLQLTERSTDTGNKYLIVQIPNAPFQFVATTDNCTEGQQSNGTCDGFAYFIAVAPVDDMSGFNRSSHFMKIYLSSTGKSSIIIAEAFARGGIHPLNVLKGLANFASSIDYLMSDKKTSMNLSAPSRVPALTSLDDVEAYFAEKRRALHRRPAKVDQPQVDERFVDELVTGKH